MQLQEINQYSHRIKQIYVENKNKVSQHDYVTIKITIDDKKDNEIIRFSMEKDSKWLPHQSSDTDYFLEIPNEMGRTIILYAHYFPVALYDYLEDQQIFSIYDWNELMEEIPISQYHNQSYLINDGEAYINDDTYLTDGNKLHINNQIYTIEYSGTTIDDKTYYIRNNKLIIDGYTYNKSIQSEQYDYRLDNNDNLIVRSILSNSVNNFKDPNYKNYTKLIDDNNISNATPKGYFPLSSRYRGYKYINAPDINQNPLPYWTNTNESSRNCDRSNSPPYWQAKIHRSGLSPLISDTTDGKYSAVNVYLNYQYLPTSTEYHQHYFGFEPENSDENGNFMVLDGENLTKINKGFGKEGTYRIISQGNPFDDRHIATVPHNMITPIDLHNGVPIKDNNDDYTCEWGRNKCDNYWVYTPNGQGHVSINVELEENESYKLQYYIYIPSDSIVEDDSCTVCIEHVDDNGNVVAVDELNDDIKDILLKQDKILRNQWIYHEIDFRAEQNNRIRIKGAQHKKTDTTINYVNGKSYRKTTYELNHDDKVYFTNFRLVKMSEYSPTLKYNDTGLYVVEKDAWAFKSMSEYSNECVSTPRITKGNTWDIDELPIPINDVYFIFDDDFDILYDEITSELSWTPYIKDCVFSFLPYDEYGESSDLQWTTNDDEISLLYDNVAMTIGATAPTSGKGVMELYRQQKKVFTTGANNSFTIILQDAQQNPVTSGEIECAITKTKAEKDTSCSQASVMCLGKGYPDKYGQVTYKNLNFKNLRPSSEEVAYFLRITYTNNCYDKKIIDFKPLIFTKEHRNMSAYLNFSNDVVCSHTQQSQQCTFCASSIYSTEYQKYLLNQGDNIAITSVEQLPLRIDVNIYSQLGLNITEGYCELSINDEVIQSTIVDENGIADFYLDYADIYGTEEQSNYNNIMSQTIKIEYFNKYYESTNFLFFDIGYDVVHGYDSRPAIPIKLYAISSGDNLMALDSAQYRMKSADEIFLLNIDTEENKNFSIGVILNGREIERQDITSTTDSFILVGEKQKANDKYIIYTDNLIGNDNGPYRRNQRQFTVVWNS